MRQHTCMLCNPCRSSRLCLAVCIDRAKIERLFVLADRQYGLCSPDRRYPCDFLTIVVMKEVLLTLGICLLVTLLLEEATALILGVRRKFDLTVIFFTNTLTNPIVVLGEIVVATYTGIPLPVYIIIAELAVWITEGLIYRKLLYFDRFHPFIVSLILNAVSFLIGTTLATLILGVLI